MIERALPPEMEIANLEHELAVLRGRASLMERDGRRMIFFVYAGSFILLALFVVAVWAGILDLLEAALVVFASAVVVVLFFVFDGERAWKYLIKNRIWDHTVSFLAIGHYDFVKQAIAAREKRLQELKGQP